MIPNAGPAGRRRRARARTQMWGETGATGGMRREGACWIARGAPERGNALPARVEKPHLSHGMCMSEIIVSVTNANPTKQTRSNGTWITTELTHIVIDEHSQPDTASRSLTAVAARPRGTAHTAHPHASPAHRSLTRLSLTAAIPGPRRTTSPSQPHIHGSMVTHAHDARVQAVKRCLRLLEALPRARPISSAPCSRRGASRRGQSCQ